METDELVHLIDLSLGVEPQGVVNFNYLHGLLHGIVQRLVDMESVPERPVTARYPRTTLRGVKSMPNTSKRNVKISPEVEEFGTGTVKDEGKPKEREAGKGREADTGGKAGKGREADTGGKAGTGGETGTRRDAAEGGMGREEGPGKEPEKVGGVKEKRDTRGGADGEEVGLPKSVDIGGVQGRHQAEVDGGEGSTDTPYYDRIESGSTSDTLTSAIDRKFSTHHSGKSRPRLVTAANDLGALDRKLQELEVRMQAVETLPGMLDKMAADPGATPMHDMWNFTKLEKRLNAAEEGLGKTSRVVDELLSELSALKAHIINNDELGRRLSEQLSGEIESLQSKLGDLQSVQVGPSESLGEEAAAVIAKLNSKVNALQSDVNDLKNQLTGTDLSKVVTADKMTETLSKALKEHRDLIEKNESTILAQKESLENLEKSLSDSEHAADNMSGKLEWVEEEVNKILKTLDETQACLRDKVDASDIASLMPTGDSDEAASLMPKLLEIQTKLHSLEAQIGTVPQDVQDQIATLRKSVDTQTEQMSTLTGELRSLEAKQAPDSQAKLDDLGSQLAQMRERMNELDRAVTALSDHMANVSRSDTEPSETDADKYVDTDSFSVVQGLLGQLQQEHERLMGTAAHLSHELDVNKEHVKSLYDNVDGLKHTKADRLQVEVEVREKADRKALEDKASRDWVDSTFERLDKEIREARSKMMGQEEALKMAVNQLNEDVDGKLDRMELQPLKDYFDKKLDHVKMLPKLQAPQSAVTDDAAGVKKPLRFACLSCDRPVELKQLGIMPALPTVSTFPGTRTFRPYTTYELEVIRRHQKLLYPLPPLADLNRASRSAGGSHTLTRPHQRFRLAPFGGNSTLYSSPEPQHVNMSSKSSPLMFEETDIVGQDGQIYKGRLSRRNKPLLPAAKRKGHVRPLTSPQKPTYY